MFRDLPRYPSYSPSNSPWLGELPSHWTTQRTKSLLVERSQKGHPDEPLLAATQSHGVIRKSDYGVRTVTATKDLHLLKLVEVGDFVVSLRSFQGGIERCHQRGIISPAYTVLTAKSGRYRDYLTYLFKSKPFIDSLTLSVTGIREGQNIDYATLAVDLLPVPPLEDQAAIVKYLAHANARIGKAITAKQRVVSLLRDSRGALIDSLILGRDRADRDTSDQPWLESIPSGWTWRRCRTLTTFVSSGSRGWAAFYAADGAMFLQSGNLGRNLELSLARVQRVKLPQSGTEGLRTRVIPNDLLVCITGALTGNVAFVPSSWTNEAYVNQHVALVRPNPDEVIPEFLAYALKSLPSQIQFRGSEYGGTKQGLGLDDVKNVEVLRPPVPEQRKIVALIREKTNDIDFAVARVEREIALLQEFRTRLVADVVTGQVDVRAVAATLPDAPEAVADLAADFDGQLDEELAAGVEPGDE